MNCLIPINRHRPHQPVDACAGAPSTQSTQSHQPSQSTQTATNRWQQRPPWSVPPVSPAAAGTSFPSSKSDSPTSLKRHRLKNKKRRPSLKGTAFQTRTSCLSLRRCCLPGTASPAPSPPPPLPPPPPLRRPPRRRQRAAPALRHPGTQTSGYTSSYKAKSGWHVDLVKGGEKKREESSEGRGEKRREEKRRERSGHGVPGR